MNKIIASVVIGIAVASPVIAEEADEDGPDMRPLVFVDEKSIENKTDVANPNFGGLVDRLNNALTESGIYRVLTPKDIGAGLVDDQLFKSLSTDGGSESTMKTPALKVAMTVMQYGYASTQSQDLYGKTTSTRQAKIELILRVVDMRSRETIKSKNISRSATGNATAKLSNMNEQVLQTACKMVVDDIVDTLVSLTPFSVLDVENGEVTIDVPSNRVKPGQQLVVYKKGKKVRNKRTGKVTAKESQVAVVGVQTLAEDSVTCKLLSGEIKPDENAEEGAEYDAYTVRFPIIANDIQPPSPSVTPIAPVGTPAVPF
ncbi:MAG: hypothetical protein IJG70_02655 [Kiritimatiellae bacterium]|nr:hypothetical protein [Kiritimatiellia bacterium]